MWTCKKKLFLTLNEKSIIIYKTVNRMCVKRCQNIFYWIKKDLFGCFRIEEIRDKDDATGLKEGGGIEMSTTVLHSRCTLSSLCIYLPERFRSRWIVAL